MPHSHGGGARGVACDRRRFARVDGNLAIQRRRHLHRDEWEVRGDPLCEILVQFFRFGFEQAQRHSDSGAIERCIATPADGGIWVVDRAEDVLDFRGYERASTRSGTASGAAGLKIYVERAAPGLLAR